MSDQPVPTPALWNLAADRAEKIRLARQLADAVDLDRGFRTGLTVTIRDLADSADALLAERQQEEVRGVRDRRHIAQLTEALNSLRELVSDQHWQDIARAVLAGEEDAE